MYKRQVLTFGAAHTLAGRGRVYIRTINNGHIAPGSSATPIGQIELAAAANLTMTPTSNVDIEIAGTGAANADRITGDRIIALDGKLNVSRINGYGANNGDVWTIISGSSVTGTFSDVTLPTPTNGSSFRVDYFPNRVNISVICYADINQDGGVDGADVQVFFDLWEAGDFLADVNNDGGVDGADVGDFFRFWEAGAC